MFPSSTRQDDVEELVRTPWSAAIAAYSNMEKFARDFNEEVDKHTANAVSQPDLDEQQFKDGLKNFEKRAADGTIGYKLLTKCTNQTKLSLATFVKGSASKSRTAKDNNHTQEVAEPSSLAARLVVAFDIKEDVNAKVSQFNQSHCRSLVL